MQGLCPQLVKRQHTAKQPSACRHALTYVMSWMFLFSRSGHYDMPHLGIAAARQIYAAPSVIGAVVALAWALVEASSCMGRTLVVPRVGVAWFKPAQGQNE
jgi:hypothetical protein